MKKLVSIFLALTLCLALSAPVLAVSFETSAKKASGEIVPYAEETEWRYRVYNGQKQKRLWSITREIWLTDWMPYSA